MTPLPYTNDMVNNSSMPRRLHPRDQLKIENFFSAEKLRKDREYKQTKTFQHRSGRNTTLKPDIGSNSSLSRREGSLKRDASVENYRKTTSKGVSFQEDTLEKTPPHNLQNFINIKEREDSQRLIKEQTKQAIKKQRELQKSPEPLPETKRVF